MRTFIFILGLGLLISIISPGGYLFAITVGSPRTSGISTQVFSLLYLLADYVIGIVVASIFVVIQKLHLRFANPMPGIQNGILLVTGAIAVPYFMIYVVKIEALANAAVVFMLIAKFAGYVMITIGVYKALVAAENKHQGSE